MHSECDQKVPSLKQVSQTPGFLWEWEFLKKVWGNSIPAKKVGGINSGNYNKQPGEVTFHIIYDSLQIFIW